MRQIRRYPITTYKDTTLTLAHDANILHFGYQPDRREFSIWVEEDTNWDGPPVERRFCILVTGAFMQDRLKHVSTLVMPDGFHVFHLYEQV